ncbi:MAG: Rho termination factor N-terminal domain-containing protein, partial [Dehalococcoidia bacterium]
MNAQDYDARSREELLEIARDLGLKNVESLKKHQLITRLLQAQQMDDGGGGPAASGTPAENGRAGQAQAQQPSENGRPQPPTLVGEGVLEIVDDGFGFLRGPSLLPGPNDFYVSQSQIRRMGLRTGDYVVGAVRPPKDSERYFSLLRVDSVNGVEPEIARQRPYFDNLTAIFPDEHLVLENAGLGTQDALTDRVIDLIAPIGRGQRGLIVAPPKTGKTLLLKAIAHGITSNYDDVHLMVA